jgi:hypothetical protein
VAKKRFRDEYIGGDFGDVRLSDRLAEFGMALAALPAASLPGALGGGAALEAAYRFLNNEAVEHDEVLAPHQRETAGRCAERGSVVVAHDTTEFKFPGEKREGLGRLRGTRDQGFLSHAALAIDPERGREPLGVLHLENWVRGKKATASARQRQRAGDPTRESTRWRRAVEAVAAQVGAGVAVHVMDREADAFELIHGLIELGERFVIRAKLDRPTASATVSEDVANAPILVVREVPLSGRRRAPTPRASRSHPARAGRQARLGIKAAPVMLAKPKQFPVPAPPSIAVNAIFVEEINPPPEETAVEWVLYTTDSIATTSDVERIVDAYRCRWRIEELFKALKTGCSVEKRQLESAHALMNILATLVPIAWRILRHRTLAHEGDDEPASSVLSQLELRILRRVARSKLPRSLTARDALLAIAALGGHLKNNGEPGWITIWRGYERLLTLTEGAALAADL